MKIRPSLFGLFSNCARRENSQRATYSNEEVDHEEDVEGKVDLLCSTRCPRLA